MLAHQATARVCTGVSGPVGAEDRRQRRRDRLEAADAASPPRRGPRRARGRIAASSAPAPSRSRRRRRAPRGRGRENQRAQIGAVVGDAGEGVEASRRERDLAANEARPDRRTSITPRRTLAPGDLGEQRRGAIERGHGALGIGAALEAMTGVGVEAEALRACGAPPSGRSARSRAARGASPRSTSVASPPMTPASATAASASAITRSVASSSRATPSRVWSFSPARRAAGPRWSSAVERVEVEGVERLPHLPQHEVGDVDHVVDRARAHRLEAPHQPVGARPQPDVLEHARRVARAELRLGDLHARQRRRRRAALGRSRVGAAQRHAAQHRDLAREPEVVHAVGPVAGDVDVEQRVVALDRDVLDARARSR